MAADNKAAVVACYRVVVFVAEDADRSIAGSGNTGGIETLQWSYL